MYLKELIVNETIPQEKKIREVKFNNHLNLIVDESDFSKSEKANGIGKTTVLKVIDICLGAKEKKSLYYDNENKITNTILESYISEKKLTAILTIADNLEKPTLEYSLKVELFRNGKCFINGEPYKKKDYLVKLNEIFFGNSLNSPTFRQLIKMFVRVNSNGDNNKFLKFLDNTKDIDYENIYNYIFELQNQKLSDSILKTKALLKEVSEDIKIHKKINGFDSIDSINQRISVLESELSQISNKINILIDSNKYKENEEEVQQIKLKYASIVDSIDKYEFKILRINNILDEAKKEQNLSVDNEALENLYKDAILNFEKLEKTFDELLKFNSELIQNKISYFEEKQKKFTTKIEELKFLQNRMFEEFSGIIMLIEDNKLEEYEDLQRQSRQLSEDKGKNIQILNTFNSLNEYEQSLSTELKTLEESQEKSPDNLSKFNEYFTRYSKLTNDEECFIYRTEKGFPLAIDNMSKNFSTGTKKSVIAAFDLAYQSFKEEIGKQTPNFVIHDVVESMDLVAMNSIVKIVNSIDCQYIVAVLSDKLVGIDGIRENDKVVKLSEKERFFKV